MSLSSPELISQPSMDRTRSVISRLGGQILAKLRGDTVDAHNNTETKAATELRLDTNFPTAVADLSFRDLAVIQPGRKTPKSLDEFKLVPITGKRLRINPDERPAYHINMPDGIRATYSRYGGSPYLDAHFGIGLVRNDWLVALSAARVDKEANLFVAQIQDVSGTNTKNAYRHPSLGERARFKTGLYDGFRWRETLIHAWIQLALNERVGKKLVIQSSANSYWVGARAVESLEHAYDNVARELGFSHRESDRNWSIELYNDNYQWPEFPDPPEYP